jgi:hypothetical protein
MWGTSSPDDKLTGDLTNVIEAISIYDRGSDCLAAGKLAPGNLGLFQQHRSKPECLTKARMSASASCGRSSRTTTARPALRAPDIVACALRQRALPRGECSPAPTASPGTTAMSAASRSCAATTSSFLTTPRPHDIVRATPNVLATPAGTASTIARRPATGGNSVPGGGRNACARSPAKPAGAPSRRCTVMRVFARKHVGNTPTAGARPLPDPHGKRGGRKLVKKEKAAERLAQRPRRLAPLTAIHV